MSQSTYSPLNKASRRQFLGDGILTSAAAIAATSAITGSRAMAQADGNDRTSPNEQIRVAVIGANGRGGSHIQAFAQADGAVVTHICDPDENVGNKKCEYTAELQYGRRPEWISDLRSIFDNPEIDAVSVATPNHWHALAAIWAVQAGKDVYCEKPVSHNVSEGRRLVQAADKYKRIVQAGTQSRSNPGMIEAIKFVHDGGLGEVRLARGLCYKRRPSIGPVGNYEVPESVNYDLWSGPAPLAPITRKQFHYDWHWQWLYGNGDLGNQGIHQMDIGRWALNEAGLSDQVFSAGGRFGYEDAGQTPNTQMIVHEFGDKRLIFEVRGLETAPYKGASIGVLVYGTEGMMVIPTYDKATVFDMDGQVTKKFSGGSDQYHYENFLSCVRSRDASKLNGPILEGHLSSALCHTGNISYRLGDASSDQDVSAIAEAMPYSEEVVDTYERTVAHLKENKVDLKETPMTVGPVLKFDPVEENFGTNASANAMLTRDYRKPYVVPSASDV